MKEESILVDENDDIIWHKERKKLEHPKDIYRVSALRLENSKWEILLQQRAFSKKNQPWVRGPAVAWTNEKWETYESNIIKESQEEIWLELTDYKIWPKQFVENKDRRYFRQWFLAKTDKKISEFRIQKEEVEAIQWISKEKLLNWNKAKPEEFTSNSNKYIQLFCKA